MKKAVIIFLAILELIMYTFLMTLVGSLTIYNSILKLFFHFSSLILISFLIYYIIRFILSRLKYKAKKYIYQVCVWNIIIGILFPIILIILIPNEAFTIFAFLMIICTCCYGIFINICISLENYFLTNRRKNRDINLGTQ